MEPLKSALKECGYVPRRESSAETLRDCNALVDGTIDWMKASAEEGEDEAALAAGMFSYHTCQVTDTKLCFPTLAPVGSWAAPAQRCILSALLLRACSMAKVGGLCGSQVSLPAQPTSPPAQQQPPLCACACP